MGRCRNKSLILFTVYTHCEHMDKDNKYSPGKYFDFSEVFKYYFRKKDPSRKSDFNLRLMHGINKVSMIMFILAVLIMLIRYILR